MDRENEVMEVLFKEDWCRIATQDQWKGHSREQGRAGRLRSEAFEGLGKDVCVTIKKNVSTTHIAEKLLWEMVTYLVGHR